MLKSRTIKIDGTIKETSCQYCSSPPVEAVALGSLAVAGRRACERRSWADRTLLLWFGACRQETTQKSLDSVASDERELSSGVDLCPQTIAMATHSPARVALMFVGLLMVLLATTFNTMTEFGADSGAKQLVGSRSRCLLVVTFVLVSLHSDLLCCPSGCRRLPAEGGGCDAQVPDAYHTGTLGLLRVGLHLFLDFCHVHVLPGWTLQKV